MVHPFKWNVPCSQIENESWEFLWSNCHLSELLLNHTYLKLLNYAHGTIELKLQLCCKLPFRMVTILTKNILKKAGKK